MSIDIAVVGNDNWRRSVSDALAFSQKVVDAERLIALTSAPISTYVDANNEITTYE